jgi:hypothetical protein
MLRALCIPTYPSPESRAPRPDPPEAMFEPPPVNPELPCETIAENTFEALRIVRQGDWVYKFLRPHGSFAGQTAEERRRQILLRVRESHRHAEINPLKCCDSEKCVIGRFVVGREATPEEASGLLDFFSRTGRGYIKDCGPKNVLVRENQLVVIDFYVSTANRDWSDSRERPDSGF